MEVSVELEQESVESNLDKSEAPRPQEIRWSVFIMGSKYQEGWITQMDNLAPQEHKTNHQLESNQIKATIQEPAKSIRTKSGYHKTKRKEPQTTLSTPKTDKHMGKGCQNNDNNNSAEEWSD